MGVTGFEPISIITFPGNTLRQSAVSSGAESGAVPENPPDLARLIAAWPTLPEHARTTILTILEAGKANRKAA
jgi:hypothetical protein